MTSSSAAEEPFDLDSITLADLEDLAAEWDAGVNGREADNVEVFDTDPARWRCTVSVEHVPWTMTVREAVAHPESSPRCPTCRGEGVNVRGISIVRPDLASLLHPDSGDPATISIASTADVLWLCGENSEHQPYLMAPRLRAAASVNPCPSCYGPTTRWTEDRLIAFVRDLDPTSPDLGPAQLFAICQQNGLLRTRRGTLITDALIRGAVGELNDLLGGALTADIEVPGTAPATPDSTMTTTTTDAGVPATPEASDAEEPASGDHAISPDAGADPDPVAPGITDADDDTGRLPDVSTRAMLTRLGTMVANCDEETADYLAASAVRAMWDRAYELDRLENDPDAEADAERIAELRADLAGDSVPDNAFAETIWERFSAEREAALDLVIPPEWGFTPAPGGPIAMPNLMQRHVATMVRDRRRYGNWSGTGAGKTVSAVLGARLIGAGATGISLVVCPNNTVDGWAAVIRNCFRDARVATKTLSPDFGHGTGNRWLVLNYDMLPGNEGRLRGLIETNGIDMLTIDEVHFVKHRSKSEMSQRRQVLTGIASAAAALNPGVAVLGLSATPVVNDLHEARSLLEIIEGETLDDVGVAPTINDAMSIHQRIVRAGTRWMPTYSAALDVISPRIDIGHIAEDLRRLGPRATPLEVEGLLVDAKTPTIVDEVLATRARGKRALIYTQFLDGIIEPLTDALTRAGLRVGHFTGDNKEGLSRVRGFTPAGEALSTADQVDVLIGSEAVGTGVDGLQHMCDTLIFATLPWTHAAYMQIVGRVHRQGQDATRVRVVISATFIDIDDAGDLTTWSWDDKAWGRIRNKQTLADCAVDGVVPAREMVTPTQAVRSHLRWLARLMEGEYTTVDRAPLEADLGDDVERLSTTQRASRYGDLSRMNGVWGSAHSSTIHSRLGTGPTEWHNYHRLYRAARLTWEAVPALVFAEWLGARPAGQRIADLGCGEMLLADANLGRGETAAERHTIVGYDHVAHDERVTVADIADLSTVGVEPGTYDYAILSLALMGANHTDYVREAHRILHTDGQLWLAEPTGHLGDDVVTIRARFAAFGFDVAAVETRGQFTFVRAIRSERAPTTDPAARIKASVEELRAAGVAVRADATDGNPTEPHTSTGPAA